NWVRRRRSNAWKLATAGRRVRLDRGWRRRGRVDACIARGRRGWRRALRSGEWRWGRWRRRGTGAGEGIRQPAAAAGVDMGCHKLSTWNSRPDPWPRRWRKKGGRIW
ncbi:hypothetical protein Csa_023833, partial [Cucumis sativus]